MVLSWMEHSISSERVNWFLYSDKFSSYFLGELFPEDVGVRLLPRAKETGKSIAHFLGR